ncbi:type I methionyl aminopeptidase [bacterium]|nr:type I methionyl aminopeptidase [bacterium]
MISIKNKEEIKNMRLAAGLLTKTFQYLRSYIRPGITTIKLDQLAEEMIRSEGGIPSFLGYHGYPSSICVSIDQEVVHGIPGDRALQEGTIVSIDIGVFLNGFHSDAAMSYGLGPLDPERRKLMNSTKTALHRGIKKCRTGNRLSDISHCIQSHVESQGFQVVRELVGHGIGRELHEEPQIPNFGSPHRGPKLKPGMTFAIEPMVNMGTPDVSILEDGWTVQTKDGLPSAHFEHTVLITDGKPEILTIGIENEPEEMHG